jgi:hypothetical protein
MSEVRADGVLIQNNGKPLYFLLNKRIPIELLQSKILPFDEASYALNLSRFILDNTDDPKTTAATLVEAYKNDGESAFNFRLMEIVKKRTGLNDAQLSQVPTSQIITKLYELGCPQLYVMHKTARVTSKYGTETWGTKKRVINANPLSQPHIMVTSDFRMISTYKRQGDEYPYLIAVPLEIVIKSEEMYKAQGGYVSPSDGIFGDEYFWLNQLNVADMTELTNKLRIYSVDRDYEAYILSLHEGANRLDEERRDGSR